ncbi:hypothetical protein N7495_009972 [Penicillium taxi]|uniref:uncharacterized protein n=1 Tax=Penicillium taxi TaxID=168475 RepID=UPI002545B4AF|nr:uncharacterized protein N7495_009972 [Penicillium taxi]KAJ5885462.1 hypothetical protein N7495_009972 [Penicillium taxi]
MSGPLILLSFVKLSVATNSTLNALEGWQFDDNSRTSWDIFWTCLSTILACTWTALHVSVPSRKQSKVSTNVIKVAAWIAAILAPELMAGVAAEELWTTRSLVARCNAALRKSFAEKERGDSEKRLEEKTSLQTIPGHWSMIHGFCLNMHGVLIESKDGWTYPVQKNNIVPFIEAGIVKSYHLRADDIKDRAKADSLAKAVTLLQSLWVTINVIARAGYRLPISPLEISTVAYVACAFLTYAAWLHKPKDMTTHIIIFLPYSKDGSDMPPDIKIALDKGFGSWNAPLREDSAVARGSFSWRTVLSFLALIFTHDGRQLFRSSWEKNSRKISWDDDPPSGDAPTQQDEENPQPSTSVIETESNDMENTEHENPNARDPYEKLVIKDWFAITHIYMFMGLVFSGIHIAAWNSEFPTKAEQTVWRVFSLCSFAVIWPLYLIHMWTFYRLYRAAGDMNAYIDYSNWTTLRMLVLWCGWFWVYSITRWGDLILMFISLRALPVGSYITIDWMSTIPHI